MREDENSKSFAAKDGAKDEKGNRFSLPSVLLCSLFWYQKSSSSSLLFSSFSFVNHKLWSLPLTRISMGADVPAVPWTLYGVHRYLPW